MNVLVIDDRWCLRPEDWTEVQVETAPIGKRLSLSEIRDWLSARCRSGRLHAGEGGSAIDAIGLNANVLIGGSQGSGRRTDANGVRLVEWLRKDLRLTTPVVLWSFLDLESLRAKHPILTLSTGLVFVRLPIPLAQFRAAFEQALAPENALSPELLEQELGRLYPGESGAAPVPAEMTGRIGALASCYKTLGPQMTSALDELASGLPARLLAVLGGQEWQDFEGAVDDACTQLTREGAQVRALEEVGTRTTDLSSFAQWHSVTKRSAEELTEAASYYRDCAAILQNSLAALASWTGEEATR